MIAIDGKTTRGSSHKRSNKKATHLINAYSLRLATPLGSTVKPDKSNEIKGIPILLKTLNIKDKIITIDAMGTQKGIANLIRLKETHYMLALKKNHGRLYRKVDTLFNKADELEYKAMVYKKKRPKIMITVVLSNESTHYYRQCIYLSMVRSGGI